jgi:hypothetical protein
LFADAKAKQWRDAEEFLDYLDTARLGGKSAPSQEALTTILLEVLGGHAQRTGGTLLPFDTREKRAAAVGPVAEASRRLLAAECSAFLVGADVGTERWAPYRRWAEKVDEGDVVITFNYDLVIEKLAEAVRATTGEKFRVPTSVPEGMTFPGMVTVLKLHGSVNWRMTAGGNAKPEVVAQADDYFALSCPSDEMVIASPGPTKLATTVGGPLSSLWAAATFALRRAEAVVFVGYRFPPTDSAARRELIDAIGTNSKDPLALHTVLGPRTHDDDVERLKAMLTVAMDRSGRWLVGDAGPQFGRLNYTLTTWPLWAQDFLDLYRLPATPGSHGG